MRRASQLGAVAFAGATSAMMACASFWGFDNIGGPLTQDASAVSPGSGDGCLRGPIARRDCVSRGRWQRRFVERFVVGFVVRFVERFLVGFVVRVVERFFVGLVERLLIGFVVELVERFLVGLVERLLIGGWLGQQQRRQRRRRGRRMHSRESHGRRRAEFHGLRTPRHVRPDRGRRSVRGVRCGESELKHRLLVRWLWQLFPDLRVHAGER